MIIDQCRGNRPTNQHLSKGIFERGISMTCNQSSVLKEPFRWFITFLQSSTQTIFFNRIQILIMMMMIAWCSVAKTKTTQHSLAIIQILMACLYRQQLDRNILFFTYRVTDSSNYFIISSLLTCSGRNCRLPVLPNCVQLRPTAPNCVQLPLAMVYLRRDGDLPQTGRTDHGTYLSQSPGEAVS